MGFRDFYFYFFTNDKLPENDNKQFEQSPAGTQSMPCRGEGHMIEGMEEAHKPRLFTSGLSFGKLWLYTSTSGARREKLMHQDKTCADLEAKDAI